MPYRMKSRGAHRPAVGLLIAFAGLAVAVSALMLAHEYYGSGPEPRRTTTKPTHPARVRHDARPVPQRPLPSMRPSSRRVEVDWQGDVPPMSPQQVQKFNQGLADHYKQQRDNLEQWQEYQRTTPPPSRP